MHYILASILKKFMQGQERYLYLPSLNFITTSTHHNQASTDFKKAYERDAGNDLQYKYVQVPGTRTKMPKAGSDF